MLTSSPAARHSATRWTSCVWAACRDGNMRPHQLINNKKQYGQLLNVSILLDHILYLITLIHKVWRCLRCLLGTRLTLTHSVHPNPSRHFCNCFEVSSDYVHKPKERTPSAKFHFHLVLPPRYWCAGGFFRPSRRVKAPLGSVSCHLYGSMDWLLWKWMSTAMKSLSLVKHAFSFRVSCPPKEVGCCS